MLAAPSITELIKLSVSPPPATVIDFPLLVCSISALNIVIDPVANSGYSNIPCGPFQKIVFDLRITSTKRFYVSSPISNPINPSSMPSFSVRNTISPVPSILSEHTKSDGI